MKKIIINLTLLVITSFVAAQQKSVNEIDKIKSTSSKENKQGIENVNNSFDEYMLKMQEEAKRNELAMTPEQKKQRDESRIKMEESIKKLQKEANENELAMTPEQKKQRDESRMKVEESMKKMAEDASKAEAAMSPEQKKQRDKDMQNAMIRMEESVKYIYNKKP